jgi:hypothetical protein
MSHARLQIRPVLTIRQAEYGGRSQQAGDKTRRNDVIDIILS